MGDPREDHDHAEARDRHQDDPGVALARPHRDETGGDHDRRDDQLHGCLVRDEL